ncbi:hypothetical protein VTO42DRAFT_3458 [Malbranchea cinnamomea]
MDPWFFWSLFHQGAYYHVLFQELAWWPVITWAKNLEPFRCSLYPTHGLSSWHIGTWAPVDGSHAASNHDLLQSKASCTQSSLASEQIPKEHGDAVRRTKGKHSVPWRGDSLEHVSSSFFPTESLRRQEGMLSDQVEEHRKKPPVYTHISQQLYLEDRPCHHQKKD